MQNVESNSIENNTNANNQSHHLKQDSKAAKEIEASLENNQDSNDDFVEGFLQTASVKKEYITKQENTQKNPIEIQDEHSHLNYFGRKANESKNFKQSKEEFKKEFLQYAKNAMSVDEMKILVGLANMKHSKLNKEHKELIKEALKLTRENKAYGFLDNGYKTILKTNLGEKIGTQGLRDFVTLMNNPKNKLDRAIQADCKDIFIASIKKINSNHLPQEFMNEMFNKLNPLHKVMGLELGR